jgi:hypothetical protein
MITISGTNWFTRSWRRLPSTRDIYEPIRSHLVVTAGIVKHVNAVGPCSTDRRTIDLDHQRRIDATQEAAI